MKNIKKITKAVAGSALLVGATLTGAAGLAAAQGGSSGDLGDYPQPFVDEDGNVQSTIVMGDSAKTIDVVGGANIAGSLGNAAFMEETKSVSVSGTGGSWSATQGVTLDTANDDLFFGDSLDEVRDTLTDQQLVTLEDTTFRDDDGDETDVENFLYPGNLQTTFGKPDDRNNEDPIHYVENPSDPSTTAGDHLYQLQANFEDEIDFAANDVEDEEIELFGNTYTVSTDTNSNELVLLGSQEETSVSTGESATITVGGEEHTFEVIGVTGSNTAAVEIDGDLDEYNEEDEETLSGEKVRISNIIQTNEDNSQGTVQFAVGSQELTLQDGAEIEDGNGDDIEGTYVTFQGLDNTDNAGDDTGEEDDSEEWEASGMNVYVGAQDDDHEYVMAGESYAHELFPDFTFHYGGLAPNAMEGGDGVGEVMFGTSGDDTVTVDMMSDGSSASLEVLHDDDTTTPGSDGAGDDRLADDDDDPYIVEEGENVYEDQYFTADAGDFAHIWEVTNIDRDTEDTNEGSSGEFSSGDEAEITLRDAVTGDTVEVNLDVAGVGNNNVDYTDTEVIDGQTYQFTLDGESESNGGNGLVFAYGTGAGSTVNAGSDDTVSTGGTGSGATTLFAPVDTDSGAAVALISPTDDLTSGLDTSDGTDDTDQTVTLELPSTESTDARTVDVTVGDTGTGGEASLTVGSETTGTVTSDTQLDHMVGDTSYQFDLVNVNSASTSVQVSVDADQDASNDNAGAAGPGVHTVLPEDDSDNEEGYFVSANYDNSEETVEVNDAVYTGASAPNQRQNAQLESDDDVTAYVDYFGAYSEYESDDQNTFSLHIPAGQATAGAAFTAQDGSMSASGAGASGSVMTHTPTGWPDAAALDSDSNIGSLKNNENLILVGGPAVNNLVSELAQENKTWGASGYTQGQGLIQHVPDAFSQGNDALVVAGYAGEDTRAAANYLANYEDHSSMLSGKSQVEINTAQGTVVQ